MARAVGVPGVAGLGAWLSEARATPGATAGVAVDVWGVTFTWGLLLRFWAPTTVSPLLSVENKWNEL